MLQVSGSFPFSASDQPLPAWPSSDGGGGGGGTFDGVETVSSSSFGSWPSSSSLTPGAGYSEELFGFSLFDTFVGPIVKSDSLFDASGWRAFAKVAGRNFIASQMAISIHQWGGTAMRLGLFKGNGDLIQKTDRFVGANGIIAVHALLAPAQLMGSMPYYMGYWSDDSTANLQFRCVSGRSTSDTAPLMQRNDLNENAANLGAGIDMMTQYRPWLMVME